MINSITENSNAQGKLAPGDIVESITVGTDVTHNPSQPRSTTSFIPPATMTRKCNWSCFAETRPITIPDLTTIKLGNGKRGLGVQLDCDANHAVLGGVIRDSSADKAGRGVSDSSDTTITSIGDQPVSSFHDIKRIIAAAQPGKLPVTVKSDAGEKTAEISLSDDDIQLAKNLNYRIDSILHPLSEPRKTTNFVTAAKWGMEETRDLIVQFYITLSRMFSGSVPAKNMMGPYGIVRAGGRFRISRNGLPDLVPGDDQREPGRGEFPADPDRGRRAVHVFDYREVPGQAAFAENSIDRATGGHRH